MKEYSIKGSDIRPEKINLELKDVKKSGTFLSNVFFWWNLVWWSLPYTRPIGRQMRFILWDNYHEMPFGLIGLQSPPFRSPLRDNFLNISINKDHEWINQSMYIQRLGSLPPYNELLGSKMCAMALVSNEIRESYTRKYKDRITMLRKKVLPSRLLFLTTTSAFGKSSIYERLKYKEEKIYEFIGYTSGSGTFHIPQSLYEELLDLLKSQGIDASIGYGTGPSRKMSLITMAFKKLKISNYIFHNVKRGYYFFPNISNLNKVIHHDEEPDWYDRPFKDLSAFWKERWCIPRSKRMEKWKNFDPDNFFQKVKSDLDNLR